jgi:hypothetical protein
MSNKKLVQHEFDQYSDNLQGGTSRSGAHSLSFYFDRALDTWVPSDENPAPTSGNNPSIVLSYDVNGNLTGVAKTIGTTTYNKTLTYNASNVLTNISSWS